MDKKFFVFLLIIGLFVFSLFVGKETNSAFVGEYDFSVWRGKDGLSVYYFYGEGCPHCARVAPFIAEMEQKYPLRVHRFDIYGNRSCLSVFDEYSDLYGLPLASRGVPAVFVSGTYFVGDTSILDGVEEAVKNALKEPSSTDQSLKVEGVESSAGGLEPAASSFSIFNFVVAALVDSISPCSIAILVFLVGARVLVSDRRKRALTVGLTFCLSVFIGYFLFGLGLLTFVQVGGFSGIFSLLVALIAVLTGLFYLKDVFWYGGGGFVMEVPRSLKPLLMKLLKGVTSPFGAFVMGFVVVCFELPCTGGPYLFILGQLANSATRLQAIPLLLFYCFIFVLPLILISLLLYSNLFSVGRMREWNESHKCVLRLIGGLAMMALGFLVIPVSQVLLSIQLFLRFFKVAGAPLLVLMFLYFFVSFAKRKNLWSKLTGRFGHAVLLISLSVAVVFTVPISTNLLARQFLSSSGMTELTLGYPEICVPGFPCIPASPFPYYAQRCPEKQAGAWGLFSTTEFTYDIDIHIVAYGKYKNESTWNRLGEDNYIGPTEGCTADNPCMAVNLPWAIWPFFPQPKPPEKDSTFHLWLLGRACAAGCSPPSISPEGVPKDADTEVRAEYDVLTIKEIKIEPKNPETTRTVTYTAELPSGDLGAYSVATSEVTWEIYPTGSRKTMSPHGGGGKIPKLVLYDNPARDTPERDTHGEKKIIATVTWSMDGQEVCKVEKEKKYKLFFRKTADDYPGVTGPNWYQYWSKHDDKATPSWDHTSPRYRYGGNAPYYATYDGNIANPTYTIYDFASTDCDVGSYNSGTGFVINVDQKGINCVEFSLAHERCHRTVDANWQPGGRWAGMADTDGDELPDDVERATPGFDPNRARSFNYPIGPDDEEPYCDAQALATMTRPQSRNDWANPGKQTKSAYRRLIFENGTNASFNGTFVDYGNDIDGDGLFDFLSVLIGLNVTSPGTYSFFGRLHDQNDNYLASAFINSTYLDTSSKSIILNFDGQSLRRSRINGSYALENMVLFGENFTDDRFNVINTSAYNHKQFEQPKAEFIGGFSESATDTNGNSLFDRLNISVAVNVTEAGYYTIIADLNNGERNFISSTTSSFLNIGEQSVTLGFDGLTIRSFRANGPYSLKVVEVQDQDYNQIDAVQDAYNTSAYLYTQFERPKAEFTGRFGDFGVDTDANGLFNILRIEAEVDVEETGNYTFSVDLADISDNEITQNYTYVWLNPGTQNITIDLNGTTIGDHGVNGPYVLTSLALYESGGIPLSVEVDYHNTSAYSYPQFERSGITEKVHDIAVTNITPSQTLVYPRETIPIYVTIENQGNYTEAINITVYANTTVIQTQVAIIESGSSETITFTWDTTGFTEGNYTISAQAWPVLATDEPDTPDNTFTDGTIHVIPEFPSFLILPLFIMTTLPAVMAYKRRRLTMQKDKNEKKHT